MRCRLLAPLIVENFVSIIPLTSRICSEVISFRHAVKGIYLAIPLNESISFFGFPNTNRNEIPILPAIYGLISLQFLFVSRLIL